MNAAPIARIVGGVFLVIGIAGWIPPFAPAAPFDAEVITLDTAYRMIFGFLPANAVLDGIHIVLGLWGVLAGANLKSAATYFRYVTWIALILAVFGAIPITNTLIGVAPIYGWNVLVNVVVALVAAYCGYGRASRPPEEPAPLPSSVN